MPDFQNFSITRNGSVNVNIPRFEITCDVHNSSTGEFIKSLSGTFPNILAGYTNEEQEALLERLIMVMLSLRLS